MNQSKRVIHCVLLMLLCLLCSPGLRAQQALVTVGFDNVPLKTIIKSVEQQTDLRFSYKSDLVDKVNSVSVHMTNASVTSVLDAVLPEHGLKYSFMGKNMIVISAVAAGKSRTIAGTVNDQNGDPVIGANVRVKGAKTGTITDIDGRFKLEHVKTGAQVEVSYVGFKPLSLTVSADQDNYTLKMEENSAALDEVVVIGYGSTTRRDLTAAMGTYKPGDINVRQAISADELLQGRVAGVNITSQSGIPGSKNRVSIRGIGSITAGNEPLWVIDGVPITNTSGDTGAWGSVSANGLGDFNPADVESIQVLKDAASAAIYGSRATNGVILVTTKKGAKGRAKVTVDANVSFSNLPRTSKLEMADTDLLIEVLNEAVDNYNLQYGAAQPRYANPAPGKASYNWLDQVLRTAVSLNTNVAISGGTEQTDYYISGSYKRNEGVIIDNLLKIYNLKTNINTQVKSWLKVGTSINLSYNRNNRVPAGYNIGTSVIVRALEQRPWDEVYLPTGEWAEGGGKVLANHNPVQAIKEETVYIDNYRAMGNLYLLFNITKDLTFKTTLAEDFNYQEEYIYYNKNHNYGKNVGQLTDGRRSYASTLWENVMNYNHKFIDALNVDAMLGYSIEKNVVSTAKQTGMGFPSSSFNVNSVAAEYTDVSTGKSSNLLQSFFGRVSLNYKDRYLLSGTLRADGSSKFHPDHRYGWFPSVSGGWNIGEEEWWRWPMTDAKIRASYGCTGNQGGIGSYAYMELASGGYNYNGANGLGFSSAGNKDLKWEKAQQYDVGVDLSFLNNAVTFSADAFIKDTKDLLYAKPMAASTGYTTYTCNVGSMRNKGIEFTLGGNARVGDFSWHGDLNISFIRNELTSLFDDNEILTTDAMHALKVGEPLGSFYLIKSLGIYQYDEEIPKKLYDKGFRAGDVKYDDYNGDGDITADDMQFCGSANPKFSGGFNNTFRWKGIDLSIFFTFSYGNKLYEMCNGLDRLGNSLYPLLKSTALGRWTGPGTTNSTPRAIYGKTDNYVIAGKYTSRFLHDASYIRCRTASIGYTFPKEWMKAIHVDNLRVYFQADNLFLITRWPFLDPEVNVSLNATQLGYDYFYPTQPRTFTVGANVKF